MRLGMGRKKIRIGDILVAAGAITEEQLQEALAYQKENGGKLGNVLVDLGMISNEILITLLTQQLGIDYIELKGAKIEEKVLHLVPENMVAKYKVIPIEIDPVQDRWCIKTGYVLRLKYSCGYHSPNQDHRWYGYCRKEKTTGWSYHDLCRS